ncbi:MAG: DNA mismatch repair endonuclease MutL, partial [Candidatus Poribacteria bacterium]|nr:DNA mismatch repair endonuclease MutL [Candidatus Poribacteria bacterium]
VRACDTYIERIRLLYGKEFSENLIEFDTDLPNLHLHCFIGKPDFTKANRNYQLFFLNKRPIRSKILGAALSEAMRSMVPKDRYAVAFLFLTMSAEEVDVNVHPAKIEVRFKNERAIYSEVVRLLNSGIYKSKYIPKMEARQNVSSRIEVERHGPPRSGRQTGSGDVSTPETHQAPADLLSQHTQFASPTAQTKPPVQPQYESSSSEPDAGPAPREPAKLESVQPAHRPIPDGVHLKLLDFEGVQLKTNLFNTYILAEGVDRVFLIDQHVAAERVLYERFVEQLKADGIPVQGLLLPATIEATPQQLTALDANTDLFKKLGFDVERFGGETILVRSIPATLPTRLAAATVTDLLDQFGLAVTPAPEMLEVEDRALITLACKSAVKAGDSLTMAEMVNLVKELSQAKLPFNCPHGRPIIVEMNRSELESRFKRR